MGNAKSHAASDTLWKFVGRESDIENIHKKLCKGSRQLHVSGMKKIGKSRVMVELTKKIEQENDTFGKCIYVNFDYVELSDERNICDLIRTTIEELKTKKNIGSINGPKDQRDESLKSLVDVLILRIREFCKDGQKITFCLDNLDILMVSNFKSIFLEFVRDALKCCEHVKLVLAQTIKSKSTMANVAEYELKGLDTTAIMKLLYVITEREVEEDGINFVEGNNVFKPGTERFLTAIANLCEGLPVAAEVAGLLLTEDDCLLLPAELLEILILGRLAGLSPDNIPPDERLDQYKEQLEQFSKPHKDFLKNLTLGMTGCEFGIDEAMIAAGSSTTAQVKNGIIKPFLNRCIFALNNMEKDRKFRIHGVLRESQHILRAVENIPSDEWSNEMVLKFMEENMTKVGLRFDETLLKDRKALELSIRSLQSVIEKDIPDDEILPGRTDDDAEPPVSIENSESTISLKQSEEKKDRAEEVRYYKANALGELQLGTGLVLARNISEKLNQKVMNTKTTNNGKTSYVDSRVSPSESGTVKKLLQGCTSESKTQCLNTSMEKNLLGQDSHPRSHNSSHQTQFQPLTVNDTMTPHNDRKTHDSLSKDMIAGNNESDPGIGSFSVNGPTALDYIPVDVPVQATMDHTDFANRDPEEDVKSTVPNVAVLKMQCDREGLSSSSKLPPSSFPPEVNNRHSDTSEHVKGDRVHVKATTDGNKAFQEKDLQTYEANEQFCLPQDREISLRDRALVPQNFNGQNTT